MRDIHASAFRLRTVLLGLKGVQTDSSPYNFVEAASIGPTLLVGEGNLSFAYSLVSRVGTATKRIIATTYEPEKHLSAHAAETARVLRSSGVIVKHAINAKTLDRAFPVSRFGVIIFQFPNVASRSSLYQRNPNHILVRSFLRSASQILLPKGEIAITVVDSPFYDGAFAMQEAATWAGLQDPSIHPFDMDDHPAYTHTNTLDDDVSAIDQFDSLQTYVFRNRY